MVGQLRLYSRRSSASPLARPSTSNPTRHPHLSQLPRLIAQVAHLVRIESDKMFYGRKVAEAEAVTLRPPIRIQHPAIGAGQTQAQQLSSGVGGSGSSGGGGSGRPQPSSSSSSSGA